MTDGGESVDLQRLLLSLDEARAALGSSVYLEVAARQAPPSMGTVLQAAAVASTFRRYDGLHKVGDAERPVAVGVMVLVFREPGHAERTFLHVAEAAHLRSEIGGCQVAVETAAGQGGVVSYWGFLHRSACISIVTLDTVDPQDLSVADLRALLVLAAERLRWAVG